MDFDLTEDQRAFQATARQFARDSMMPNARAWDEGEIFSGRATCGKAAALGFGGIYVKDDVGGSALTRLDATIIFEELAQGCTSTAACISDPQHGGLDDRRLRRRGRSARSSCRSSAPWSISPATA